MIVHYMEIDKMTGSSLGFGKTLLSALYNIFLTTVLSSMHNPGAPVMAAVEHRGRPMCQKRHARDAKGCEKKSAFTL